MTFDLAIRYGGSLVHFDPIQVSFKGKSHRLVGQSSLSQAEST